jgi:hypothetical protein
MSSRALTLATVLLIGCCTVQPAESQAQNLEAGKTPSQIFSQTCSACHKGPRGLLRTVPAGSLSGFLRQHYTTSPDMAGVLASFLISNGATDGRYAQPKAGREGAREAGRQLDAKPAGLLDQLDRFGQRLREPRPEQERAQPEHSVQSEPTRRNARHLAHPAEQSEGAPSASGVARGADGRQPSAEQRMSKRGRPATEEPKVEAPKDAPNAGDAAGDDRPKAEPVKIEAGRDGANEPGKQLKNDANSQAGNDEGARPERTRQSGEGSGDAGKPEPDAAALRAGVTAAPSGASDPGGTSASSAPAVTSSVPPASAAAPTPPTSR